MGLVLNRFHEFQKKDYYCAVRGQDEFKDKAIFQVDFAEKLGFHKMEWVGIQTEGTHD